MTAELQRNRKLWFLIAPIALVTSLIGVAYQGIFQDPAFTKALPAFLSQDMITVLVSNWF